MMYFNITSYANKLTDTIELNFELTRIEKNDTLINPITLGNYTTSYASIDIYDTAGKLAVGETFRKKTSISIIKLKDHFYILTGKLYENDEERHYRIDKQNIYTYTDITKYGFFEGVDYNNNPFNIVWVDILNQNKLIILIVGKEYALTFYIGDFETNK